VILIAICSGIIIVINGGICCYKQQCNEHGWLLCLMSIVGKLTLLVWRWLLMAGSVLTLLSVSVLFLGVTCIECKLELRPFPEYLILAKYTCILLFTDGLVWAGEIMNHLLHNIKCSINSLLSIIGRKQPQQDKPLWQQQTITTCNEHYNKQLP
jgi:hypothetical protein